MKTKELLPNQIITLNDYPVYNDRVLRKYYKKVQLKKELPLVPVIKSDIVIKHFEITLKKEFKKFTKKNPAAEYFILDGNHRTTALTLTGSKIKTIIFSKDEDILEAKKLVSSGKILENAILNHNLVENCLILSKHFKIKPTLQTVLQKTEKMIKDKIVPQFMIDTY